MGAWWNALDLTVQILYCIAIPSSLILVIQAILLLVGFGGSGEGVNPSDTTGLSDADADFSPGDAGDAGDIGGAEFGILKIFSLQGVMIFFCVFGWASIILIGAGAHTAIALIAAFLLGFLAMYGVARLLYLFSRLGQNGTFDTKNLLGAKATVYVPIPAKGGGRGKVTVALAERYMEYEAETDAGEVILTNTPVRIVDIRGEILVVECDE